MLTHHTCADGREIPITELEDDHLENIINYYYRLSLDGYTIMKGGGNCPEDFWYDEYTLYGQEALDALNYEAYQKEKIRRLF